MTSAQEHRQLDLPSKAHGALLGPVDDLGGPSFIPPSGYDFAEVARSLYVGGAAPGNPFDWGADVVVSLAATHACPVVPKNKLLIHHRMLDDGTVGDPAAVRALAKLLAGLLDDGRSVLIHCVAGRDRSPMLAARILIEQGMTPSDAIAHVRSVRQGALGDVPPGLWGKAGRGYARWLLSERENQ
jgi:hypothetical protein